MAGSFARDVRSVPNLITISRIVLIVSAAPLFFYVSRGLAIGVAVVAGLTDYLDGAVARATGQVTRLGEILDQLADLCFESFALVMAVSQGFFSPVILVFYLLREFWVTGIRRYMAQVGLGIPSSLWGKMKTNLIGWGLLPTFLSMVGALPVLEPGLGLLGRFGVWAGIVCSYLSAVGYSRAFVAGYGRETDGPLPG